MAKYTIVHEKDIEHKNEYFELQISRNGQHKPSIFFTTNEENLDDCAAEIVREHAAGSTEWRVVPHLKH